MTSVVGVSMSLELEAEDYEYGLSRPEPDLGVNMPNSHNNHYKQLPDTHSPDDRHSHDVASPLHYSCYDGPASSHSMATDAQAATAHEQRTRRPKRIQEHADTDVLMQERYAVGMSTVDVEECREVLKECFYRYENYRKAHDILKSHLTEQLQPVKIASYVNKISELDQKHKQVMVENKTLKLEVLRLQKEHGAEHKEEHSIDVISTVAELDKQVKFYKDKLRELQAQQHEKDKALRRGQQQVLQLENVSKRLTAKVKEHEFIQDEWRKKEQEYIAALSSGGGVMPSVSHARSSSLLDGRSHNMDAARARASRQPSRSPTRTSPTRQLTQAGAQQQQQVYLKKLEQDNAVKDKEKKRLQMLIDKQKHEIAELTRQLTVGRTTSPTRARTRATASFSPSPVRREQTTANQQRANRRESDMLHAARRMDARSSSQSRIPRSQSEKVFSGVSPVNSRAAALAYASKLPNVAPRARRNTRNSNTHLNDDLTMHETDVLQGRTNYHDQQPVDYSQQQTHDSSQLNFFLTQNDEENTNSRVI